jgi:hypothetical protein
MGYYALLSFDLNRFIPTFHSEMLIVYGLGDSRPKHNVVNDNVIIKIQ